MNSSSPPNGNWHFHSILTETSAMRTKAKTSQDQLASSGFGERCRPATTTSEQDRAADDTSKIRLPPMHHDKRAVIAAPKRARRATLPLCRPHHTIGKRRTAPFNAPTGRTVPDSGFSALNAGTPNTRFLGSFERPRPSRRLCWPSGEATSAQAP